MFITNLRRSGRWFPERSFILEHPIFSFGKMILRDRCSTSYDLASLFRGKRNTLDRWSGKLENALVRGRQFCTQLSIFEGSLAEMFLFLMLSTSKIEEDSHNCFVCDVVKFKTWGCLADLPRFCCCQVQKLRMSRRLSSFSSLQIADCS